MKMQIYDLTKPELDELRELCNFTPEEREYFDQRANHKCHVQIGLDSHWSDSKINALSRSVRKKIKKIRADF